MKRLNKFSVFAAGLCISMFSAASLAMADDDDALRCTAEVTYDGNTYHVKEGAWDMEDAKREVIEEACDDACDHLSGRAEKMCESTCESNAVIRTLDCVAKKTI